MASYATASISEIEISFVSYAAHFDTYDYLLGIAETTTLLIETEPSGANIYLDSVFQGTSSLTISDLAAGTYSYTASLNDNYYTYYSTVDVEAGTNILSINLIPNPFVTSSADHAERPPLL